MIIKILFFGILIILTYFNALIFKGLLNEILYLISYM